MAQTTVYILGSAPAHGCGSTRPRVEHLPMCLNVHHSLSSSPDWRRWVPSDDQLTQSRSINPRRRSINPKTANRNLSLCKGLKVIQGMIPKFTRNSECVLAASRLCVESEIQNPQSKMVRNPRNQRGSKQITPTQTCSRGYPLPPQNQAFQPGILPQLCP